MQIAKKVTLCYNLIYNMGEKEADSMAEENAAFPTQIEIDKGIEACGESTELYQNILMVFINSLSQSLVTGLTSCVVDAFVYSVAFSPDNKK